MKDSKEASENRNRFETKFFGDTNLEETTSNPPICDKEITGNLNNEMKLKPNDSMSISMYSIENPNLKNDAGVLKQQDISEISISHSQPQVNGKNAANNSEIERGVTTELKDELSQLFGEDSLSPSYVEMCLDMVGSVGEDLFYEGNPCATKDLKPNESLTMPNEPLIKPTDNSPKDNGNVLNSDFNIEKNSRQFETKDGSNDLPMFEIPEQTSSMKLRSQQERKERPFIRKACIEVNTIYHKKPAKKRAALNKNPKTKKPKTTLPKKSNVEDPSKENFPENGDEKNFISSFINSIDQLFELHESTQLPEPKPVPLPEPEPVAEPNTPSDELDNFQLYLHRKTTALFLRKQNVSFFDPLKHENDFYPADEKSFLLFNQFYSMNKGTLWIEVNENTSMCLLCNQLFEKDYLISHLNNHYMHYFICKFCTSKQFTLNAYRVHMSTCHAELQ